ncbi:MAG: helix-turn-helix transcriptional regulator [Chloroflexota bacterium]
MPTRTRPLYEADRLARWQLVTIGRELRVARIIAGLTQREVAERFETSASRVCRVEGGQIATLRLADLTRHAAIVGLKPYVRLYPLARRLLDARQLALLGRLHERIGPAWKWETEVAMPIPGDLRAADCRISIPTCVIEAYTRFADYQAQSRSGQLKLRDPGADHLILLVEGTRANRRAVAEASARMNGNEDFPLGTREMPAALAESRDPGANGIAFL